MSNVRVMILRAAGTNCDLECEYAWTRAGALPERIHVRRLIENPALLDEFQVVTIPGGFSYGDDISAGRVFAAQLERRLADRLRAFIESGRLILGICNGFQVLVKCGLLPYSQGDAAPICTVTYNEPPGFQDRWVWLRAESAKCVFLDPQRYYEMPIAHGEGRVLVRDITALSRITEHDQAALRYVPAPSPDTAAGLTEHADDVLLSLDSPPAEVSAEPVEDKPTVPAAVAVAADTASVAAYNPNGSMGDLAGLCDETGRVFGLMPHPDRFIDWVQHPCWTSLPAREAGDGLAIFQQAVEYLR